MSNSVKTNSVKKAILNPKKAPKKSENVILKTQINQNWKLATRSMSGLTTLRKRRRGKRFAKINRCNKQKRRCKSFT